MLLECRLLEEVKSHIVVVCEGDLDKCFIREVARRLGLSVKIVDDLRELSRNLRILRPPESSNIRRVIVFSTEGPVESSLHRVLNYVIDANRNARTYLSKVLALIDQDDFPTPISRAHQAIQSTLKVVNNSLECELVRILTGETVRNRRQCHRELKKLKRSLGSVQESENCRGYSKLVSNAIDVIENSSSQPPWYTSIKCFLQGEL